MYETFFGLKEPAFSLTPDPRYLWPSETHQEGFAALYYGITRRKGFLLLTGEVGAGKTTLLRAVLDQMPTDIETALILNTADLTGLDLLKMITAEFRLEGSYETRADYLIALNHFLLRRLQEGLNTVLIIDEAQNLDDGMLEQVRLLSNLETNTEKLIQIVLTGQPELRDILAKPVMSPLRQRIALEHHVQPIAEDEVAAYLGHRIQVAGGSYREVFEPGVEDTFFAFSSGCPRLLNLLADRVLLAAFAKEQRPVRDELIEKKAMEMWAQAHEQSSLPESKRGSTEGSTPDA